MPSVDLVERSADLKRELLKLAQHPRYERAFQRAIRDSDGDLISAMDRFVLQDRLRDGRTLVDHFVAMRQDLSEADRAMVLSWKDVVEGLFEVERRDGDALIVVNLIDELTYRVRSNMGPSVWKQTPKRSFIAVRLVPVGDEWLISGAMALYPASERVIMYQTAAQLAASCTKAVFRNPAKLATAWEMQREERKRFIAFFGADQLIVPGPELAGRMREYLTHRAHEALAMKRGRATLPVVTELPLPADLNTARIVGVIYDDVEGLCFYPDFDMFEAVFADPLVAADRDHRRVVLGYLKSDSISPMPFRRLGDRDPERASQVFQRLLKRPAFSWERDGEELLRRRKPKHFATPRLPSITPMSDRQVEHLVSNQAS